MAEAGNRLRIKYGLSQEPTEAQIERWAAIVRTLYMEGRSLEEAGEIAARRVFPDYRSRVFASEADTIETLLRLAEEKK